MENSKWKACNREEEEGNRDGDDVVKVSYGERKKEEVVVVYRKEATRK